MHTAHKGFTLVELLVVLAIVATLTTIATISVSSMLDTSVYKSGVRAMSSMKLAQNEAIAHCRRGACVYESRLVTDSVTYRQVLILTGAAVFLQVPQDNGEFSGLFLPAVNEAEFRDFGGGMCIPCYTVPADADGPPVQPVDVDGNPDYRPFGLTQIRVYWKTQEEPFDPDAVETRWAHVFGTDGKLDADTPLQLVRVMVAPHPSIQFGDRFWSTQHITDQLVADWAAGAARGRMGFICQTIALHRSMARIRLEEGTAQ